MFLQVLKTARPNFLILTPVCIFLGVSPLIAGGHAIDFLDLSFVLIGGLLAHTSANALNEYYDFKSGLDLITHKTAFSGGTGTIPAHPEIAPAVFKFGTASLFITVLIGLYFIQQTGWPLLPLGLAGVALIIFYTGPINRIPLLCLLAPGIGFGLFMVIGTQLALLGHFMLNFSLLSFVPLFLVSNLLLLNQYPDVEADTKIGRRHLPIAYGIATSNRVYSIFALLSLGAIIYYVISGFLTVYSLISILPMFFAFVAYKGAVQFGKSIGEYPHYLAANVLATLLTPFFLAVSISLGEFSKFLE